MLACRICCQRSGWSWRRRLIHHAGWFQTATSSPWVATTSASRSRRKRRRQALTKPAWARVAALCLAACTAWFTKVNGS